MASTSSQFTNREFKIGFFHCNLPNGKSKQVPVVVNYHLRAQAHSTSVQFISNNVSLSLRYITLMTWFSLLQLVTSLTWPPQKKKHFVTVLQFSSSLGLLNGGRVFRYFWGKDSITINLYEQYTMYDKKTKRKMVSIFIRPVI